LGAKPRGKTLRPTSGLDLLQPRFLFPLGSPLSSFVITQLARTSIGEVGGESAAAQ
jgi:hypothetical protein